MFSEGTLLFTGIPEHVNWGNMPEKLSWLPGLPVVLVQHMLLLVSEQQTGGCLQSRSNVPLTQRSLETKPLTVF